jgi:hypothetical protein
LPERWHGEDEGRPQGTKTTGAPSGPTTNPSWTVKSSGIEAAMLMQPSSTDLAAALPDLPPTAAKDGVCSLLEDHEIGRGRGISA